VTDIQLTQAEADALIALEKHRVDGTVWRIPIVGGGLSIPLQSADRREQFVLDIYRGRINLMKGTHQTRGRAVVVLVRLDFGGSPHRNPDGEEIGSPHLHVYREGFGDKWAMPVPLDVFANLHDLARTLDDFMDYCHVVSRPAIGRELFA
jgi:hypothetical protein